MKLMSIMRPTAEANPRAISTRIKHKSRVATNGQRHHNLRLGRQPDYVDGSRSSLNRVLMSDLPGGDLRAICDQRREASGQIRQRKVSESAAVSVAGIITFGKEAQPWVEELPRERQDDLFREVAEAVAQRLGTSLHGLVVHLDESAIHAHYQLAAVTHEGRPVSKVATKVVLNQLQDLVAEVARRYDRRIERGHRKADRLAAGATPSEVVNRTVRELHRDLPREKEARERAVRELDLQIATRLQEIAELQVKLAKNVSRAEEAQKKAERLAENAAKAESALKNAATYERRAAAAGEALRDAQAALAALEARQAALVNLPEPPPPTVDTPPILLRKPAAWAEAQNQRIAEGWHEAHQRISARARRLDEREVQLDNKSSSISYRERDVVNSELKISSKFNLIQKQIQEIDRRKIEIEKIDTLVSEKMKFINEVISTDPIDIKIDVLPEMGFATDAEGKKWKRNEDTMEIIVSDSGRWKMRISPESRGFSSGSGALSLITSILRSVDKAILFIAERFGRSKLLADIMRTVEINEANRDAPAPSISPRRDVGPGM